MEKEKPKLDAAKEYMPSLWHKEIKFTGKSKNKTKPVLKTVKKSKKKTEKNNKPVYVRVLTVALKITALLLSISMLLFSSAAYAYKESYVSRAMYGTKILGEDVGGKTEAEIQKILKKKVEALTFNFSVEGSNVTIKPYEAGVVFNTKNTAREAVQVGKQGKWYRPYMHASASLIYRVYKPAGEKIDWDIRENLSISYKIDEAKLEGFTKNLSSKFDVAAQNAALVMNGTEVQVIPATAGRKIMIDSVKKQIAEALETVKTNEIKIDVEKIDPEIVENDTKEAIARAKTLISLPVAYTYQGQKFTPDQKTVASWIVFNTRDVNGKQTLVPEIDTKVAYSYVYSLASKINVPTVNKKVTVKNGGEQIVEAEGKEGLAVDIDQAVSGTAASLNAGKGVSLELRTYAVKYKTQVNNIFVADWSKYIEINISTQTMCAYLAGGVKVNCWSVTTGQNGWNTPTGTFLIQRKSGEGGVPGSGGGGVCMPNPPSAYPLCGINYVSTFTPQGHAIHEAWWRSNFGGQNYKWNGSHGCINATYDIARFIFYWAPIGTPVIIHY